jgi:pyruvate dehydrogenase E2 component (dihydrolipoamide acetyltransferase)
MPAVSANADRAVLLKWSVGEKSDFAVDDTLAEVETDKAVVDIDAESDGVLIKQLVAAGAEVEVGAPIAVLGQNGERDVDIHALLTELGVVVDSAAADGSEAPADNTASGGTALPDEPAAHAEATVGETPDPLDTTEGAGTSDTGGSNDKTSGNGRASANGAASAQQPATAEHTAPARDTAPARGSAPGREGRLFASPLARRLAAEVNLSLTELTGSGPDGRIRRDDVREAIQQRETQVRRPEPVLPPPLEPAAAPPEEGSAATSAAGQNWVDEPHSRVRTVIANRLTTSKSTVPHFYLSASARVDRLLALRAEVNGNQPVRVSVNDLVIAAAARAHVAVPAMNAIWTEAALRRFSTVDISVAVASKKGLVTPTLRGVERLSVTAVATRTKELVAKADAGRLRPDDLEGGALTISNLGMFGVDDFAAIINPPQSAILAVGAARSEAVVVDGRLEVGTVLRMTLSVDHRAVDGAVAAQWFTELVGLLENPVRVLV